METERAYGSVAHLARTVVKAGYPVVVDGTFLQRRQREQFRVLAADLNVPFVIVDFVAPVDTLHARVQKRQEAGLDASEADSRVLEHQLRLAESLTSDERAVTVTCDGDAPLEPSQHVGFWRPVLDRLHLDAAVVR